MSHEEEDAYDLRLVPAGDHLLMFPTGNSDVPNRQL